MYKVYDEFTLPYGPWVPTSYPGILNDPPSLSSQYDIEWYWSRGDQRAEPVYHIFKGAASDKIKSIGVSWDVIRLTPTNWTSKGCQNTLWE